MTLALGVFIFGTFFGLGMGRLFCKQHHKNDKACTANINAGGADSGCCSDGKCNN